MKILHLTDHLPEYHQPWGGAEKVAYRHIYALIGHQKDWQFFVGTVKPLKRVKEKFRHLRIWTIEDFFPKRLHLYITGFKNQIFPFDPIAFFSTLLIVQKIKPDLIHIHKANKISFAPIIVGKLLKIPVVLAIYDYWYFCPAAMLIDAEIRTCRKFQGQWCKDCSGTRKFGLVGKIAAYFRKPLFDFFLGGIDSFLVLSKASGKLLEDYGIPKKKIHVVRQVFYGRQFKKKIKVEKNKIFFNAWMAPHKGPHVIVQAMAEVVKKIPDAKLNFETKVLDPVYEKKVRTMVKDLGLEDNISIFERSTVDQYLENIASASVVVVAEQWENMASTTLADAMSLGRPIVTSDIGGLPEMVRDGEAGLTAKPNDPKDFAQKIVRLLKNPQLGEKFGKQAKEDIKRFGEEKEIRKQMLALYQDTFV